MSRRAKTASALNSAPGWSGTEKPSEILSASSDARSRRAMNRKRVKFLASSSVPARLHASRCRRCHRTGLAGLAGARERTVGTGQGLPDAKVPDELALVSRLVQQSGYDGSGGGVLAG